MYRLTREIKAHSIEWMETRSLRQLIDETADIEPIVGPFGLVTNDAGTFTREYEIISWGGHSSDASAWAGVVNALEVSASEVSEVVSDHIVDDPGWIRGCMLDEFNSNEWIRWPSGDRSAYLWLLQNHLRFLSSSETALTNSAGDVFPIYQVLVTSLGDYTPHQDVTVVWPQMDFDVTLIPHLSSTIPDEPDDVKYMHDLTTYYRLSVIKVEMLSDKAANSPKTFNCGQTTVASPCGQDPAQAEALVVYYNSVFNYTTKVVDDFDVTLRLSPTDVPGASWAKVSGPNSGSLVNANQAEAIYRNPKKGGVYLFDATVGSLVTRTQLWHPVAGPDISAYWNTEIGYFRNTWGPAYRTRLDERTVLLALWPVRRALARRALAAADMLRVGNHLDWNGAIVGQNTPCAPPGWGYNLTIAGVVVEQHKWNNMMYAEIGREMGILEAVLLRGGDPDYNPIAFGHPDTDAAREAYRAGFDLSDGASLETAIHDHGYGMQEPDSGTQKEWPSDETSSGSLNRVGQPQLEDLLQ